ncbi:hypothetical protein ACFOON_05865 [Novosphingobium piscinae]|uniref:Uncharacterized protein n=1 Tax=Novosphingobium piscinae TaxID=1507448 RepID=A0A7X1FZ49_9SPHN|nr:hypothetical protein [Novosphingobium piscinae]MBC2669655.1 hypothetical protein [Novosphingobium piscinae]
MATRATAKASAFEPPLIRNTTTGKLTALAEMDAGDLMPFLSAAQMETIAARFPAYQAGAAAEFEATRVSIVAQAVAADPECQGKADVALGFLADENLAGVNGEGLVRLIKAAASPLLAEEARHAEDRAFMREMLAQSRNSTIDAGNGGAAAPQDAVARGWKRAADQANARFGLGEG